MNKLLPILVLLLFNCDVEDILDYTIHTGCSDENACNYSSQVTADDGSCEYPPIDILGCDCDNYEIIGECSNSGHLYCQESACYD